MNKSTIERICLLFFLHKTKTTKKVTAQQIRYIMF